ncbi:hypothetical protein OESDEN_07914 [Oesophagostomum dentatum]|uniref:Uncharacterized protein n=1 Tax=Oesophagostomum dentatum TaxID=61180 RepID=A0A0B1TA26_OESDE|nr:hypothetical protein OESDEN_07914 [Oesophagostomum dentatum]
MISQLRSRTQRESTIEETDGDGSSDSGKTPSIDTPSSAGERIVFDFPFDNGKSDSKEWEMSPKQLPGLKVGRKSLDDIRELRSSIDHSLIKPPKLQRQKKKNVSINSYKGDSDSDRQIDESEDEPKATKAKSNMVKAKSPFRPAVESGSDLESIDFEEASSPSKTVHFLDEKKPGKSSTSSKSSESSSSRRSSASSQSTTSTSSTSRPSAKSKTSSESSTSRKYTDFFQSATFHDVNSDANSEGSSTVRESPPSGKLSKKAKARKSSHSSKESSSTEEQTEAEKYLNEDEFESTDSEESSRPSKDSEFCSSNLHHVTKDVLKTHLELLKEFNRLEFSSLQEWNAILDDVRKKYEGPSTEKLQAVLDKRFNRMNMQTL